MMTADRLFRLLAALANVTEARGATAAEAESTRARACELRAAYADLLVAEAPRPREAIYTSNPDRHRPRPRAPAVASARTQRRPAGKSIEQIDREREREEARFWASTERRALCEDRAYERSRKAAG